jgi:hypothetical protein
MLDPKDVLYGRPIKEIARICGVDLTTARRWKRGAICPPQSALSLLAGDLGFFDPAWRGWRLKDGHLLSPEAWEISMSDVLASRLHEAQLREWRRQVAIMKAKLAEMERGGYEDQPTPEQWDVEILAG